MRLEGRRAKVSFHRFLALIVAAAVAMAVAPDVASANDPPVDPWPTGWASDYMQRNSDCTDQADPINLMFYSAGYRTPSLVETYLAWWPTTGGDMYVWDNGQCFPSDQRHGFNQRESPRISCHGDMGELCEWYHIRLWDGWGAVMSPWAYYTGAGIHLDEDYYCPPVLWPPQHKGVNYNETRDYMMGVFASRGNAVSYMYRGNKLPSPQHCSAIDPDPTSNGWVGKIQLPPPMPGMSKAPATANLWVWTAGPLSCQGQGVGELGLEEQVTNVTTFDWNHDDQFDGAGRYQYDVTFDSTVVAVTSQNSDLLGSTGRSVSCGWSSVSGGKRFWCQSSGSASQPGPLVDPNGSSGVLATACIKPAAGLINRTSDYPRIRPTKNNYIQIPIYDENCTLKDISGNGVPGSSNGLLPYCYDAQVKVRILEGDVSLDCMVDVLDDQTIAYRYGATFGLNLYAKWYDLEPQAGDWDIDIKDLQTVFGRNGSTCQNPIPAQPP